jgi:hypothetical protein
LTGFHSDAQAGKGRRWDMPFLLYTGGTSRYALCMGGKFPAGAVFPQILKLGV